MKNIRIILTLMALTVLPLGAHPQKTSGFNVATAIGHATVTLLTPAAISNTRSLSFNNVSLPAQNSLTTAESANRNEAEMQTASVRIFGNNTTYNVSVPDLLVFKGSNGKRITLNDISVQSDTNFNGSGTLYIGARMRVHKTMVNKEEGSGPLAVTINFN